MKKLALLVLALCTLPSFGQAFRVDLPVQTLNTNIPQPFQMYPVIAIPFAEVDICTAPAVGNPCTNRATTFTDATGLTACPTGNQLTRPNSNVCLVNVCTPPNKTGCGTDAQGYWGAWMSAGTYQYTIQTIFGSAGPFDLSVGGGGGGSGGGITSCTANSPFPIYTCNVNTTNLSFNLLNQNPFTLFGNFNGTAQGPFFAKLNCTGLLNCNFDNPSNTLTMNVPPNTLAIRTTNPIKVNGANGPVSSGDAIISCPDCNATNIDMKPANLPTGLHVLIYPTSVNCGITGLPSCDNNPRTVTIAGTDQWQGTTVYNNYQLFSENYPATGFPPAFSNIVWSFTNAMETQAPDVPLANITGIYIFTKAGYSSDGNQQVQCNLNGVTIPQYSGVTDINRFLTGSVTPDTVQCGLTYSNSGKQFGDAYLTVGLIGLAVYYTGTPSTQSDNKITVDPPLTYINGHLGVDPFYPSKVTAVTCSTLAPFGANQNKVQMVSDYTSTSVGTTCAGGGSIPALVTSSDTGYTFYPFQGAGGGGTNVLVNGSSVSNPNFNGTSPLPDTNFIAATFKVSAPNVILEVPFGTNAAPGVVQCDGTTITCAGGIITGLSGTVGGSGTAGWYSLWSASLTLTNGALDHNITTLLTETFHQAVQVLCTGCPTQLDLTYTPSHAPSGTAGSMSIAPDATGNGTMAENGGSYSRICTAANGICATSGAGSSIAFNISTGVSATPASPFVVAPTNGTVSHCYFTTTTSDGATNLVFNVKFNGTNIISGTNATVTAGTSAGTISTFNLTSGTITVTQGQKWELDITGGTSSWTGVVQCY